MTTRARPLADGGADDSPAAAGGPGVSRAALTEHRNEVVVAGRLASAAQGKELPSGDTIVNWRLIVDRGSDGPRKVDVVDCTTFVARIRRQALGWHVGDVIEVTGALRRRFWRGGGGLQSRCEVEAVSARRVVAAPRSVSRRRTRG
jgi:single-strand DNA-binding protein